MVDGWCKRLVDQLRGHAAVAQLRPLRRLRQLQRDRGSPRTCWSCGTAFRRQAANQATQCVRRGLVAGVSDHSLNKIGQLKVPVTGRFRLVFNGQQLQLQYFATRRGPVDVLAYLQP